MSKDLSRRQVLAGGATLAAAGVAGSAAAQQPKEASAAMSDAKFRSRWHDDLDRVWLGRDYWAAPLQDWRVVDGAAECTNAAPNRVIHLLTAELADRQGGFTMSVKVRRGDGKKFGDGKGSVGFRIGIRGPLGDYRNALLYGKGIDVGLASDGTTFIGKFRANAEIPALLDQEELSLHVTAQPDDDKLAVTLTIESPNVPGATFSDRAKLPAADLVGNVALVANFGAADGARGQNKKNAAADDGFKGLGAGTFRFSDWTLSGDKFDVHDDRAFGPILFMHYTLSRGTLKLTAQFPPLGDHDNDKATLDYGVGRVEAQIHPQARTATFRIDDWDSKSDRAYLVEYDLKSKKLGSFHADGGTIRHDPVDEKTLTVGDVSCNTHAAFPNERYVEHMRKLDPDLLAFVGDQFYESTAGYGVTTAPLDAAILDYLRKWYCHGWTWRELTRNRPSISIPDDHDVYQGNIWGENGAAQQTTQEAGGYRMPGPWVNVCYRTQTSHHPDPYDATPIEQGIIQYFGRMVYGGVDFAILADRQYKTGPEGMVPSTGGRGDHVTDPKFDPKTADLPGLQLLGPRQEEFLAEWADDWSAGKLKAVISQTIFTAMATTHGSPNGRLIADYDTNGWPQSARNRAVKLIRKACAFHIAGDQHLPAVIQYGVDSPRDGSYAFAGPAVNVGYPRWWEPQQAGAHSLSGGSEVVGEFLDAFGNHMHVVAFANGAKQPRQGVLEALTDKTSGLGIVRFDKTARKVTVECWPFDVDPTTPDAKQFAGWPVTVELPPPTA